MCGRFTQRYTWSEVHAFLSVIGAAKNLRPRYNIAPTTMIDVVRQSEGGRELVSMRWGLVPVWWKKPLKEVPATFNARAETVAEKPMFRDAFKRRRCIIPASGFFGMDGWQGREDPAPVHRRRWIARPGLRRLVGPLDGSGERRRGALGHYHRVGGERLDGAVPRPHAGASRRRGLRRLARRIAWP